jgi:hypothetical protein
MVERWYYCYLYRWEPKERQANVEEIDEEWMMLCPMVQAKK